MREEINLKPLSAKYLKYDLPAGLAVFFVAVPLCLGIAHASGAPLISGLITGMLGGVITGLTAIAIAGIIKLGSFEAFLLATVFAGIIQILLGVFRVGFIANYIPSTVIKGMLSAIGLILINLSSG